MQGPTQRWNQPPDPRESTVSMPRIDPSSLANQVSEPAGAAYDGGPGMDLPGFGDPYALPVHPAGSAPAAPPAPATAAEPEVTPERAATPRPALASPPEPEAPPLPATPEPAGPEDYVAPETPGQSGTSSRGATGQPPRRAARRAEPSAAGKPPRGSIAELRARLERLPDGHPSSPYDDAGWQKPSPTRLRQLELGLPARSLSAPAGYAERLGIDPDDDRLNDSLPGAAASSDPQASTPGGEQPGTAAPAGPDVDDAPAGAASRRAEAGRAAAAGTAQDLAAQPGLAPSHVTGSTASNGHRDLGEADGPLQSQHPYAASAGQDPGRSGPGAKDLALTRWPPRDTAADRESGRGDNQNGHRSPAKPPEAGPAEPASPDREPRQPDPARDDLPRRADGAAAARPRLAPELRDLVDRTLAACRAAEGRNARGGYGTSGLTPALRRIAAQLPDGGLAPGSEADTLKPADRFAARLARLIDRQPGRPPAELAATISDGIRYAFTFPAAGYTEGTLLVHRKLKAQGFDLEARRNQWDSREYKGVFTRWRDPAHGLAFEVQFHTTDSWAIVKQTHDTYLQITDPLTPASERARLRARQAAAAATVSPPPGCMDIADFRAAAR